MNDVAPSESQSGRSTGWLNAFSSGCDLPWVAEVGALLLRLFLGCTICWRAGISKFPLDAWFTQSVADLGFPLPTVFAWLAAMSEVAGGVLLAVGLCTRPAAFFLAFTLGVAAFRVHDVPLLSVFAWQHITISYFWAYVFFLFAGAGRLSLDGALRRRGATAAGLAALTIAALSIACAMRTAPEPTDTPAADVSSIEAVSLAGSFNDWSPEATPMDEAAPGVWSTVIEVPQATLAEFKFVGNSDWNLAAGETDQAPERFPVSGVAEVSGAAGNIEAYLPSAGQYEFRFTLDSLGYTVDRAPSPETTDASSAAEPPATPEPSD